MWGLVKMSKLWLFWLLTFSSLLLQGGWDRQGEEGGIQTKAVLLLQGSIRHQSLFSWTTESTARTHREPRGTWPLPPTHLFPRASQDTGVSWGINNQRFVRHVFMNLHRHLNFDLLEILQKWLINAEEWRTNKVNIKVCNWSLKYSKAASYVTPFLHIPKTLSRGFGCLSVGYCQNA